MALADLPKIPEEYKPRVEKLAAKIRAKEISPEEVQFNVLAVLGKVTIGAEGIKIEGEYGSFEIDERALIAGRDFLLEAYDLLPRFWGREFLIKRGNDFRKIRIGLGLKSSRASEKDINNTELPVVEYFSDPLTQKTKMKVHRSEEFAGWLGDDWSGGAIIFKIATPLSELLTKEILDKLNEPMAPFCDQVLEKCGV